MSQFKANSGRVLDTEQQTDFVETITTEVADAEGVDPCDLVPLYEVVDPDALNNLVGSDEQVADGHTIDVVFAYHGYEVTVGSDGTVDLAR